jgi:type IV pilus assembly protein PilA
MRIVALRSEEMAGPRADPTHEGGFTLVELMVVVMVIGILIVIAIPNFLGAKARAQDRATQASIRNALSAAKVLFSDRGNYSLVDAPTMTAVEPSLTYEASNVSSIGPQDVSVSNFATKVASDSVSFAALSRTGTCFFAKDVASSPGGGTMYGSAIPGGLVACQAVDGSIQASSASW